VTNPDIEDNFIYWLAGLIDGDGSLLVNKNKALSCEITVDERDVKALFEIKERYHGSVLKRSNVKAYRWRVSKKVFIEKLYKDLNSKLITDGKKTQLINMGKVLNIEPKIINYYDFKLDSAWLSGFLDADGSFTIRNAYTLTISIAQKTPGVLYSIQNKLNCGNVYYDKKGDTYNYAITDIKGIKIMLKYLSTYPLKTSKRFDYIKFCRLVEYKELKYHYKNNLNKPKIDSLVKLFRERYKT
jgi:LAGLIDADG endonuclease